MVVAHVRFDPWHGVVFGDFEPFHPHPACRSYQTGPVEPDASSGGTRSGVVGCVEENRRITQGEGRGFR